MAADTNVIYPLDSTSDLTAPDSRHMTSMITAQQLKELYLWGVKLTNQNNIEIPDAVLTHHINSAVSFVEHSLNICVWPATFVENKDFRAENYTSWNIIQLDRYPVQSITHFKTKFLKALTTLDFPPQWYRIYKLSGQVQLTPTAGTLNAWSYTMGGIILLPTGMMARKDFPQLFEITYLAGFEKDKIPFIINDLVATWAALNVICMLANVVIAPGVSASSISLDGLGRSQSKTPTAYDGLIQQYAQKFLSLLATAKGYYCRLNMQII